LQKILAESELSGTDAATLQRAASSAMRQTRDSPKALAPNLATRPRHQYGLQIAEGMVTSFESYERELEKYWTKRSSSNSAGEYRRYLIRVMRTAGDISPHAEMCQSRKQITGDVRHGSIKRVASAVGEGSIAIELVHQYLDRF
jgi:hypothetical protein